LLSSLLPLIFLYALGKEGKCVSSNLYVSFSLLVGRRKTIIKFGRGEKQPQSGKKHFPRLSFSVFVSHSLWRPLENERRKEL
jgi:hypothetical protein